MGAFIGLLFGTGLLSLWAAWSYPGLTWRGLTAHRFSRRRDRIRQAGLQGLGAVQMLTVQLSVGIVVALLVLLLTNAVAVAVALGAFASALPMALLNRLARRRQRLLRELWPEAIDNLASAVRAGMSLADGLSALAQRGPEPLRPAFARFGSSYRVSGRFNECLDGLKADIADPVGDRVCETIRFAREVGGTDLGVVLRTLADLLRVEARTRAEIETRQGWIVNAAKLAVAAPWLVLLILGSDSHALQAYNSPTGVSILAMGAGVCVAAYRLMMRIARLPADKRVLA